MPLDQVPEQFTDVVQEDRASLTALAGKARAADRAGLTVLADEITELIRHGNSRSDGHFREYVDDLLTTLDPIFAAAFPVTDPSAVRHILEVPWPTRRHRSLLVAALGCDPRTSPKLDDLADRAVAEGDIGMMRAVLHTPLGFLTRQATARVLDALHSSDELAAQDVERAFTDDRHLWTALADTPCADAVRGHLDALVWRRVTAPVPATPTRLPADVAPRGLRFVRLALDWTGDEQTADHLGAADLTGPERAGLLDLLRERPAGDRHRAWRWRTTTGDAEALLPLFGLEPAAPLLRLIRAMPDGHEPFRQDRAAVLAAVEAAGLDTARRLLLLAPSELVSAVLGDNRAAVLKRVKNNALQGIAAFGMLPLVPGETVLDRYLALRESAKKGAKLGPNRRHSHAAAIGVALDHLAQVTGAADASRLEWDCEARIAEAAPTGADAGDYWVEVRFDGAEPVLAVSRAGKPLRSVPAAVRADPAYQRLREHQELLRDQARRMRTGLMERLVATTATLSPDELARLRSLPAGAAVLPALIWRDSSGTVGLLDELDVTGPVTAVHPADLLAGGTLARWQERIVRDRIRQPVKQAFRELYVPTPAEREAVDVSQRFAGQNVSGRVAAQLLSARGWSIGNEDAAHQATRPAGAGLTAALSCEFHGYFGLGDVLIGGLVLLRDGRPVPLAEVPPVVFSEVMRDLDLVVSVAGTEPERWSSPAGARSRADVLTALIAELGLTRVAVDGTAAVVRGSRATYRVHLTSGSIHVEPAGYLCVVPAGFGATAHRRLFLPFADEDRMTSVILSKVLLLAEDEKITDPSILQQLDALRPDGPP
ncbi:DUF4132 domain-containing protein [Actinoplanes sp. NPDC023801]|uniref:DUF4132 domain-containing protein n=1 Tax=Actinoplanes sp. NPDC023801 TaxID=3154595 RepID=UPI0033C7AC47